MAEVKTPTIIGQPLPRKDTYDKAIGAAQYTDDLQFGPGLLHARIKRSPHAHALIKNIDVSKAEQMPGVKVVVTGEDFPGRIGLYIVDRHIFARDRARYVGEPVAAVAAISEEIAEKAVDLIEVEYEVLEGVFDPIYGASKEAPLIHPKMDEYYVPNYVFPQKGTNISNWFKIRKGDVDKAFEECTEIVEHEFKVPHVQHVPIETHIAIAKFDLNGKLTLWASSQSPFAQRDLIAKTFDMSQSDIRVIAPYVGGGFGCKAGVTMEALPVAIAQKIPGVPVKLALTREEEFYTNFVRQGLVIRLKVGCDKDGNLLAMKNTMYWDGGGYTDYGVNITRAGGYNSTGPYDIPNVWTDSMCVYTNHPVGGAYRGFGMSELHTGVDQAMDMLADKIGMPQDEFRLRNCVQGGDTLVTSMKMHPTGLDQCIKNVAEALDINKKEAPSSPTKLRGKGMALMWKAPSITPNSGSAAKVALAEDGTLVLSVGGQEIGQGAFSAMAQITAAVMGVPYEDVKIDGPVDTQYSPYEWQTVASRLTWSMGNAVKRAAEDARRQVLELVGDHWNESPDDLDIVNGMVVSYKSEQEMSLEGIGIYGIPKDGYEGWKGNGPIIGRGSFMPNYISGLDAETGQGTRAVVHYTTGCQGFDIEIDKETGKIEILKAVSSFDVGKAINMENVEAQIEGGLIQGVSSSIFEEMLLEKGEMKNPSFVDYRISTTTDLPKKHEIYVVEVPQDDGPYGARGIGEHPMVPTIAALGNAIYDATGIRLYGPPFTPEKVFLAMVDAGLTE